MAGLAGLEGVDLAAVDLVDDARLGGMALKRPDPPHPAPFWGHGFKRFSPLWELDYNENEATTANITAAVMNSSSSAA